jgi:hypothetical protein
MLGDDSQRGGRQEGDAGGRLNRLMLSGSPPAEKGLRFVMQLEVRVKGLQGESDGGIGFYGHSLEGVEELSALAGEESVRGEARDCGHGACKLIG